jgi:hypothetical protein
MCTHVFTLIAKAKKMYITPKIDKIKRTTKILNNISISTLEKNIKK